MPGFRKPAQDQRERRQAEVRFGLAAAGGEEEQVHDLAVVDGSGSAMPGRFISRKASWNGRHLGWIDRRRVLALHHAQRRLRGGGHRSVGDAERLQSNRGSSSSAMPCSMRSAAGDLARWSSSSPVSLRRWWGLGHLRPLVLDPDAVLGHEGAEFRLASRRRPARRQCVHASSTSGMLAGATRSTSASGNPAGADFVAVESRRARPRWPTLWPTANSQASRYCRSATRSSQSSLAWLFMLGRGMSGSAEWTVRLA